MKSLLSLSALALLLLGCVGYRVRYDYDRHAPFAAYRTYAWTSRQGAGEGDPFDAFTARRVRFSVNQALSAKGFHLKADGKEPDFLVEYFPIYRTIHVDTHSGLGFGHSPGWGFATTRHNYYRSGTLILRVVDFRRDEVVWQAEAEEALPAGGKAPEDQERILNEVVHRLLDHFPPDR